MIFTDPLFILLIGVLIVVGGIIGLRLHPFLALLLGASVVAQLTPTGVIEQYVLSQGGAADAARALANEAIGTRVASQFGATCQRDRHPDREWPRSSANVCWKAAEPNASCALP